MNFRALIGEFLGVFGLCFVGILAIKHLGSAESGLIGIAFAHGLIIAVLVGAFAVTSGAHFNPAVTISLWAGKRIDTPNALGYIAVQVLGGLVASLFVTAILGASGAEVVKAGTPALAAAITGPQAAIAEFVGTFLLMIVIYGSAVDKRAPQGAPLFIGLVISAVIFAIGPISGAALNPARYIGPALVGGAFSGDFWVWLIGPILGALAAGVTYEQLILKGAEGQAP